MNLRSYLIQRLLRLDAPLTRDLTVERDLRVPMPDGIDLLADRWAPRSGGDSLPTALVRSPYGRRQMALAMARPLAERGFQVLLQSTRGTFGSGGVFDPLRLARSMLGARRSRRALDRLPLGQADQAAIGRRSDYVQDILTCPSDHPRW